MPDERLRVVVSGIDPVTNVFLQCCNAFVYTAAEQLIGQECEPSLDLIDPGGPGRGEVDVKTWVLGQPVAHCRRLVSGQVVADEMHAQLVGGGLGDRGEELLELHGPVTSMKLGDHRAVGDVERREQAGDAAAGVVMTAPSRHAGHHRQHRLGTVQCLHLTLLVHAQDDGTLGWIVLQANNIDDLVHELRIRGKFEAIGKMRFEFELATDPADRRR